MGPAKTAPREEKLAWRVVLCRKYGDEADPAECPPGMAPDASPLTLNPFTFFYSCTLGPTGSNLEFKSN